MPSKRFCFVVLAIVALLALATLTEAKGKFPKKQLHQARCGGTHDLYYHFLKRNPPLHAGIQTCQVVMKNLESVRENGEMITNKSPYGFSKETLISEALIHVCGVSVEHLKTLNLDANLVMEACMDVVTQYDEELEELFRERVSDPKLACMTTVPLCKGLKPDEIIEPHDRFEKPRHPFDRDGASQRLPE